MKAVILSAGRGTRLQNINGNLPKCMLKLGSQRLVDYQLESLRRIGVTRAVFVVGYKAEAVKKYLENKKDFHITFIENESFADTNTAYSLNLAGNEMDEDIVFFNGDVLFQDEILRRVCFSDKDFSLAVERKRCCEEEVKVTLDGARITEIGKHIEPSKAYGEFIGLGKCSASVCDQFRNSLLNAVNSPGGRQHFFEAAINSMLSAIPVTAVDITDQSCIEIDFPEDLLRAKHLVLPRIEPDLCIYKPKILFYVMRNLHLPFLEPIHDYIAAHYPVECAFSAPPHRKSQNGMTGCGLEPETVERLKSKSAFYEKADDFPADIAVVADACYYPVRHCRKVVNVGHGMISKGLFFTDSPMVRRENLADLICVPGQWHKDILEKNVYSPIAVTGFIKTDKLAECGPLQCRQFMEKYAIAGFKKFVLFAPTFNEELSAIPCVRDRIAELGDEDTCILIKLHGMTDASWVTMYLRLAETNDRVRLIEDGDFAGAMNCADVMVSDVSSIFIEFMLLDKPVVLFNNPRQEHYHQFDEQNIEYQVRDAALQVSSIEELRLAVRLSLADPGEYSIKRMHYAQQLNAAIDGKCAQRAAHEIIGMLTGASTLNNNLPFFSIIVNSETPLSEEDLRLTTAEIRCAAESFPYEIIVAAPGSAEQGYPGNEVSLFINSAAGNTARIENACNQAEGDYIVVLRPGMKLPRNFLKLMHNYFRWHSDAGAVKALSYRENYQDLLLQVPEKERPGNYEQTADYLKHVLIGNQIPARGISASCECIMFPAETCKSCCLQGGTEGSDDPVSVFGKELVQNGYSLWNAVEVFVYPAAVTSNVTQANEFLARAREQKQEKDYEQAIVLLEKAKNLCPKPEGSGDTDISQLIENARTLKRNKQYQEAAAVLECAKKALLPYGNANRYNPNNEVFQLLEMSRQHKKNKEYYRSIELLEEAKRKIA